MLGKLFKYDSKRIYKFLIIFYSFSIFFAILTRIFLNIDGSFILHIVGQVCSGVTISMIANILINNIMRVWVLFKKTLYDDESYLTHTLPVDKKTIYLSKIMLSIVSMFTSVLVIGLTLWIAYYSKENIEALKNMLMPLATSYHSTIIEMICFFLILFFIQFINIIQLGYSGIILGHRMNYNKVGFSVIYGFLIYMASQLFTLLSAFIISLFHKDLLNLFFTNEIVNLGMLKLLVILCIIIYVVIFIINLFINIKLFQKGVNVE